MLDVVDRSYPLIHPDWVFFRALGESVEKAESENRRLLYVAVTRAVAVLYLFTERDAESPYLAEIERHVQSVNWADYPPVRLNGDGYALRVHHAFAIKDYLKAEGFQFNGGQKCWEKWVPCQCFTFADIESTQWARALAEASLSEPSVEVLDGMDQPLAVYQAVKGRLVALELKQTARIGSEGSDACTSAV